MKPIYQQIWASILMGAVLPGLMLRAAVSVIPREETKVPETEESREAEQSANHRLSVLTDEGKVREMELESYLCGVVLGEMPADFEQEALKAQAVVARTFTLRSEARGKHEGAAVCMDSGCCQAYIDPEDYLLKGGTEAGLRKIREAVESTAGEVLTYGGEMIEATYFSCSGGRTEDAVTVWGTDVPYLRATDSPGEEKASHFRDEAVFSAREFREKLRLADHADLQPENIQYSAGGGVQTLEIGGKTFEGTEVRKLLGLRSTVFQIKPEGENVRIETRGFGHRVGMSQYGADAMAESGSDYRTILAHYYPGTELKQKID